LQSLEAAHRPDHALKGAVIRLDKKPTGRLPSVDRDRVVGSTEGGQAESTCELRAPVIT
jgi:hypothetical protein